MHSLALNDVDLDDPVTKSLFQKMLCFDPASSILGALQRGVREKVKPLCHSYSGDGGRKAYYTIDRFYKFFLLLQYSQLGSVLGVLREAGVGDRFSV